MNIIPTPYCDRETVFYLDKCITLIPYRTRKEHTETCKRKSSRAICSCNTDSKLFENYFYSILLSLARLFTHFEFTKHISIIMESFARNKCYITSRKNTIYWKEFEWEILQKPCDGVEGLFFCTDDPNDYDINCPEHLFRCKDKTCIAQLLICDGQRDCPSGEDEESCGFKSTDIPSQIMMLGTVINPVSELTRAEHQKCHNMSFICPGERCIPFSYVCDGVIHCKQEQD